MQGKENNGGVLKNEQVEEDLKVRSGDAENSYRGMQNTGDKGVRRH